VTGLPTLDGLDFSLAPGWAQFWGVNEKGNAFWSDGEPVPLFQGERRFPYGMVVPQGSRTKSAPLFGFAGSWWHSVNKRPTSQ